MSDFGQISIFAEPEKDAYLKIRPEFLKILHKNGVRDEDRLSAEMCKDYFSVKFDGSVVFRIYNKKRPYITVPGYTLLRSAFSNMGTVRSDKYFKFTLSDLKAIEIHLDMLKHVLQKVLDSCPNEFDCCSRFQECSDAKRCIHSDRNFAFGCGYRKILKSGRIFYGVNRNID